MNWKTKTRLDNNAILLVNITQRFLVKYFEHDPADADRLITRFFESYDHVNEDYVHHNSSWKLCCNIHSTMHLDGDLGEVIMWQVENDLVKLPEDVKKYMKKHYWGRLS